VKIQSKQIHAIDFGGNVLGHLPQIKEIFEGGHRLRTTVNDLVETITILKSDTVKSIAGHNKAPQNQYWKRSVIKNLFAWLEGQTF
jgi:hypothetical protein